VSIRDWVELAFLIVITASSIGRWVEAREQREKQNNTDMAATRGDLAEFEKRHSEEHEKIWREIERNRDHWHKELVPKLQGIIERVAVAEGAERAHGEDLRRLQTIIDRRRGGRD
jgi:hypothetical protein